MRFLTRRPFGYPQRGPGRVPGAPRGGPGRAPKTVQKIRPKMMKKVLLKNGPKVHLSPPRAPESAPTPSQDPPGPPGASPSAAWAPPGACRGGHAPKGTKKAPKGTEMMPKRSKGQQKTPKIARTVASRLQKRGLERRWAPFLWHAWNCPEPERTRRPRTLRTNEGAGHAERFQ